MAVSPSQLQASRLEAIFEVVPAGALFVAGMAGLGVMSLIYGDFALQWQPFPQWVPWRMGLAYASGILVLVSCIGVFFKRTGSRSALILTVYQLVWAVLLAAEVVPHPMNMGRWLGFCEAMAVLIAGWLLYASFPRQSDVSALKFMSSDRGVRAAQLLFGLSCVVFGLSHFAYAEFTADMIPYWFPAHLWFAYLTGACHFAAGVAILSGIFARLAATLEALMMTSFVFVLHAPSIVANPPLTWAPTSRIQWTSLFMASALAGSAWIIARSLRARPRL